MRLSLALVVWCFCVPSLAADVTISLNGSLEVPLKVYPAKGKQLLLVLPSEHGFQQGHEHLAQSIASLGTEVWLADFYAAYFLPVTPSGLREFVPGDISRLIDIAQQKTGKTVFLLSHDAGVVPMLYGVREWQATQPNNPGRLGGLLMISPNLYAGTPSPGQEVEYLSIAGLTNMNIYVIQPMLSPKSWQLQDLLHTLEKSGSDVYLQRVKSIRDRFFFRPDADAVEEEAATRLVSWIQGALPLLAYFDKPRQPSRHDAIKSGAGSEKAHKGFQPYAGSLMAHDFELADLKGDVRRLSDYRGKVVLLNFWASWCPPCIHEMPSMQSLKDRFKSRPFEIVAVNMAEDRQTITDFLKRMSVDFEILLDRDGTVLRQWRVFAYPTSYVLDAKGQIRYAGFGAIDWEEDEVMQAIGAMLEEVPVN